MNKTTKITLIAIAVIILAMVGGFYTYNKVQAKFEELESKTIDSKLQQIKEEARNLEKEKEEYEKKNIDAKLQDLYSKSLTLQSLGKIK